MGVPDFTEGAEGADLHIPSLFLSKREGGGATLLALRPGKGAAAGGTLAEVALSFGTVEEPKLVTQRMEVLLPGGADPAGKRPFYSQPGAKKALLLASLGTALKAACRGRTAPADDDIRWFVPPPGDAPGAEAKAEAPAVQPRRLPPRRGGRRPVPADGGAIPQDEALKAAEGLGRFGDWFASQIGGIEGFEPELRLLEQLENTLRKQGGREPRAPREIPARPGPDLPPPEVI
jgi:hypothetical protein